MKRADTEHHNRENYESRRDPAWRHHYLPIYPAIDTPSTVHEQLMNTP